MYKKNTCLGRFLIKFSSFFRWTKYLRGHLLTREASVTPEQKKKLSSWLGARRTIPGQISYGWMRPCRLGSVIGATEFSRSMAEKGQFCKSQLLKRILLYNQSERTPCIIRILATKRFSTLSIQFMQKFIPIFKLYSQSL